MHLAIGRASMILVVGRVTPSSRIRTLTESAAAPRGDCENNLDEFKNQWGLIRAEGHCLAAKNTSFKRPNTEFRFNSRINRPRAITVFQSHQVIVMKRGNQYPTQTEYKTRTIPHCQIRLQVKRYKTRNCNTYNEHKSKKNRLFVHDCGYSFAA